MPSVSTISSRLTIQMRKYSLPLALNSSRCRCGVLASVVMVVGGAAASSMFSSLALSLVVRILHAGLP